MANFFRISVTALWGGIASPALSKFILLAFLTYCCYRLPWLWGITVWLWGLTFIVSFAYFYGNFSEKSWYRAKTAMHAARMIWCLPKETVDRFMDSYSLFDEKSVSPGERDQHRIMDYYAVVNYLCSLGEVEKMYIPPVIDETIGVFDNQLLWERQIAQYLVTSPAAAEKDKKKGGQLRFLDAGCGRGRVAAHVARQTGAHVTGFNVDPVQLGLAKIHAEENKDSISLEFHRHDLNVYPLPFADASFDGMYQIQVFTYAIDREALCRELYRVLVPGARVVFLDYVLFDKFQPQDPVHADLLRRVKPLLGAVADPYPRDYENALKAAGFNVEVSEDASPGGHQSRLIRHADDYFRTLKFLIEWGCSLSILPAHFATLFERLCRDCDAFIEGDEMGLFTTSYKIVACKPALA